MKTVKKSIVTVAMTIVLAMSATGCGQKLAPADQTISALFELAAKDNATPMKDLLGFASEEETKAAFFEDDAYTSVSDSIAQALEENGIEMSAESQAELTQTMTNMINKISCTAEITSESSDSVEVTLTVTGYNSDDMNEIMMDAATAMQNSLTAEDAIAIANGDMDVFSKYMEQYLKDFFSGLSEMELSSEPVEIVVKCEKLSVEAESGNKVAWLPSNMNKFANDVNNSIFQ